MLTPTLQSALHSVFEWLGIALGFRLYMRSGGTTLRSLGGSRDYVLAMGCILGAALGNKLVHWIQRADQWALLGDAPWLIFQGQSIVGGLLGGLLGVELAKYRVGQTSSTGDRFVTPILLGLVVGRIGCFIAGLSDDTYGIETRLAWGVDFGDGLKRHPTQLYDIAYATLFWLFWRHYRAGLAAESGLGFKLLLSSYLLFRLLVDALKPVPFAYVGGLSGIQLTCCVALVFYLPLLARQLRNLTTTPSPRAQP
jgi:phosphatidylglycerol---prolipoprotein diacylglyceryl transferase